MQHWVISAGSSVFAALTRLWLWLHDDGYLKKKKNQGFYQKKNSKPKTVIHPDAGGEGHRILIMDNQFNALHAENNFYKMTKVQLASILTAIF